MRTDGRVDSINFLAEQYAQISVMRVVKRIERDVKRAVNMLRASCFADFTPLSYEETLEKLAEKTTHMLELIREAKNGAKGVVVEELMNVAGKMALNSLKMQTKGTYS